MVEIGKKYFHITPIRALRVKLTGTVVYECKCDCGSRMELEDYLLTKGRMRSCGCASPRIKRRRNRDSEYTGWRGHGEPAEGEEVMARLVTGEKPEYDDPFHSWWTKVPKVKMNIRKVYRHTIMLEKTEDGKRYRGVMSKNDYYTRRCPVVMGVRE